jgi:23S rRNA pseudouridine1911/1915/1917 synthase
MSVSHTVPGVDEAGQLRLSVEPADAGARIDRLLGRLLSPHYSRSFLSALVEEGRIRVDGREVRVSYRVNPGQLIEGELGAPASSLPRPEAMQLTILHSDEALIVVDKPAGLVIHPGTGQSQGTLVNGLLQLFPELSVVGRADRPGIVHRLDRDTTGVMVVARNNEAARSLVGQFKSKVVHKEYSAVVWGQMPFDSDWIDLPLGPHPSRHTLRAVRPEPEGQASSTFYAVEQRFSAMTLVNAQPRTGRTHQIRVHLEHIGFPIVGDDSYGRKAQAAYGRWVEERRQAGRRVPVLARQALHARRISLLHPATGERVQFESPLPADLRDLVDCAAEEA